MAWWYPCVRKEGFISQGQGQHMVLGAVRESIKPIARGAEGAGLTV